MNKNYDIKEILNGFPKERSVLDSYYQEAFYEYYTGNRNRTTITTKLSGGLEGWMHKKIARTKNRFKTDKISTIEIGAGTLNQLCYEPIKEGEIYDIIEPNHEWVDSSSMKPLINTIFDDIADVPIGKEYDRVISCATFEHLTDLPYVIAKAALLIKDGGVLSVGIPNEGRFLWKFALKNTTGREFHRKYGLDYEIGQRYEHVNTADEIDCILRYMFESVNMKLFGVSKNLAFYRYYECTNPYKETCEKVMRGDEE